MTWVTWLFTSVFLAANAMSNTVWLNCRNRSKWWCGRKKPISKNGQKWVISSCRDFRWVNFSERRIIRRVDFGFRNLPLLVWRSWFHESSWRANCSANRLSHSQIFLRQAPALFVQTILFFPVSASSTRSAEYPTSSPRHFPSCVTLFRFKIFMSKYTPPIDCNVGKITGI